MDNMEEKLGSILNNPQMMQQIMTLAQGLQEQPKNPPPPKPDLPRESQMPDIDMKMLQNISRIARQSNIDKRDQALLRALGAYLSKERIGKLERAMRAAKLAKIASTALAPGGINLSGR